jgi:hypothetical protein
LHADPAVVQQLREQAKQLPTCCNTHGDINSTALQLPPGGPDLESRSVAIGSVAVVPFSRLAYTAGLQQAVNANPMSPQITVSLSNICRLHGGSRCRYSEVCRFVHVCRDVLERELAQYVPPLIPQLEVRHSAANSTTTPHVLGASSSVTSAAALGGGGNGGLGASVSSAPPQVFHHQQQVPVVQQHQQQQYLQHPARSMTHMASSSLTAAPPTLTLPVFGTQQQQQQQHPQPNQQQQQLQYQHQQQQQQHPAGVGSLQIPLPASASLLQQQPPQQQQQQQVLVRGADGQLYLSTASR